MKQLAFTAAIAAIALAAPASAAVTYNSYDLTFANGAGYITPAIATAPGEYQETYTFTLGSTATFSGSLSTQRLRSPDGTIVSDLDFGNSLPTDGVFLSGGTLGGNLDFQLPTGGSDTLEVENLASTLLGAGTYTLTVNYTVTAADALNGATYAGPVFAAMGPSVPSVPEPATWAMFVGAFGLAGVSMRQRRSASVTFG